MQKLARYLTAAVLACMLGGAVAHAQGSPGLIPGQKVVDGAGKLDNKTAPQWNGYFEAKENYSPILFSLGNLQPSSGQVSTGALPYFTSPTTMGVLTIGSGLTLSGNVLSASGMGGIIAPAFGGTGVNNGSIADTLTWHGPTNLPSGTVGALVAGTSVNNPGTGNAEFILKQQTNTTVLGGSCTASCAFTYNDFFWKNSRFNTGSAMTDSLPASGGTGMSNGSQIQIGNADATATDTISAGAGTTINGNSTYVLQPGRDIWLSYDGAGTWRPVANSNQAVDGAPNLTSSGEIAIVGTAPGTLTQEAAITSAQCISATISAKGCVIPDNSTITISGSTISAVSGSSGLNQLHGDCAAGPGVGNQAITCTKINGVSVSLGASLTTSGAGATTWNLPPGTSSFQLPPTSANLVFGAYAPNLSNDAQDNKTTTGTISLSTPTTLTLGAAEDFVTLQGIRINHAGATFTASAPSSCTATAHGGTGTSYTYYASSYDGHGGVGARVSMTVSGPASLTTSAYNAISCTVGSGSPGIVVWGGPTSGSQPLEVLVAGGTYDDIGATWQFFGPQLPNWLPASAPTSALPDWLVTQITAGGGTTTLTIANAATNAVTGATVVHDDTVALQAGFTAACNANWPFHVPPGYFNITSHLVWCVGSSTAGPSIIGEGISSTIIAQASPNDDFIQDATAVGGSIHDLSFVSSDGGTTLQVGGAFINVLNTKSQTDDIYNIYGIYGYYGIEDNTSSFNWSNMTLTAASVILYFPGRIGDATISNNYLSPQSVPGATSAFGLYSPSGDPAGIKITSNKFLGTMNQALYFAPTLQDGGLYINGNSFECLGSGVLASCGAAISVNYNSALFGGLIVAGPGDITGFDTGIVTTSRTAWMSDVNIGHGMLFGGLTTGVAAGGVIVLQVNGAQFDGLTTAISTDSNTSVCTIGTNTYNAVTTKLSDAGQACGVWTAFTPTVTCSQSTGTAVCTGSGRYTQDTNFKTTTISISVTVSGTFTAGLISAITLPNQVANHTIPYNLTGREDGVSGVLWVGEVQANSTSIGPIGNYAGSNTIVTGDVITLTGTYENQ